MSLIRLSADNPASLLAVAVLVAVLGIVGIASLPIQMLPDIEYPEINVNTSWRSAAPQEVEANIVLRIHARGKTHVLRGTMKRMEQLLDRSRFARVHRSTIINVERVRSTRPHTNGECFLTLEGDKEVKVSRSYRDGVKGLFGERFG